MRTLLTTIYAAGLRVSEAVALQVGDIDSARMTIHVRAGKGQRDRYVMLAPQLLAILRAHWRGETPPAVVFLYAEDRKGEHPAAHLAGFQGILQVDGYSGFKGLLAGRPPNEIRLAFCWAHCRRRFYELHQATRSPLGEKAPRRIGELYAIEAQIRGQPAEVRRAARQERSRPIVNALHLWLTAQLARVSGKSGLPAAIRYALRHWQGLVLFRGICCVGWLEARCRTAPPRSGGEAEHL